MPASAKDEAIRELAHVARELLEGIQANTLVPGIFIQALTSKIDYYESLAETS
jgi:hypothetical protein